MKTVMITGANRGLGRAMVDAFFNKAYKLILNTRTESKEFTESKELIETDQTVIIGDLLEQETIRKLAAAADKENLDILINNAGIYMNMPFPETLSSSIRHIIDTDLVAPILLTRAIWPIFKRKGSGLVININSVAGKQGSAGECAYSAAKHGLKGFAEAVQYDAARDGIQVMSVFLGAMDTDISINRPDKDILIDPKEAAETILSLCEYRLSTRISEITINRRRY